MRSFCMLDKFYFVVLIMNKIKEELLQYKLVRLNLNDDFKMI